LFILNRTLDVKTGLLTGLLTGMQGWKYPVVLSQTCYGSKSLKVILMDSNFGGHPVLNSLVTLWSSPTSSRTFFEGKKFIFLTGGNRSWRTSQMGEGRVSLTPCADFYRPVEELEYTDLLRSTFTHWVKVLLRRSVYSKAPFVTGRSGHVRGFKTWRTVLPVRYRTGRVWMRGVTTVGVDQVGFLRKPLTYLNPR
jgi:hypothetical protein